MPFWMRMDYVFNVCCNRLSLATSGSRRFFTIFCLPVTVPSKCTEKADSKPWKGLSSLGICGIEYIEYSPVSLSTRMQNLLCGT